MKIDDEILEKYKEIAIRLRRVQKQVVAELKINLNEFKIISVLSHKKSINQTELSEICNIDKPAVSRLVVKMCKQDYIARNCDHNDRRNFLLYLSGKGKEISAKAKELIKENICLHFNQLNQQNKEVHLKLLNTILNKGKGYVKIN
ncbi:MAG: MarR family winged helix-turn-helix transcriptional regulator [Christensenellales bacterium]